MQSIFSRKSYIRLSRLLLALALLWNANISAGVQLDTIQQNDTIEEVSVEKVSNEIKADTTRHPLKPPDVSSPRATLKSFIESMDRSYRILMEAHEQNQKFSGLGIDDALKGDVVQAELIFDRAFYCLDMSAFPPSVQKDIGYGRAIMLKEILDRIELPDYQEIPGKTEVEIDLETKKYPSYLRWKIPNTDIVLVKQLEGLRQGEYQFSSETVENLPQFYEKVKHLPYVRDRFTTSDFYDFYRNTPGLLLPPQWSSYLPDWSSEIWKTQTIWQWIAFALSVLLSLLVIRLIYVFMVKRARNFSAVVRIWLRTLFYLSSALVLYQLYVLLSEDINLTGNVLIYTRLVIESLFWTLIAITVFHFFIAVSESLIVAPKVDKIGIEAAYTRAVMGIIAILAAGTLLVFGLTQVGVSVVPLLTGVGIGGIAIALAARSTIENVISSFTIFLDKPYRVGDRVKVMGHNGTIEDIGIRSTKIRLLQGTLVTIPNEKMASAEVENIQTRPFLRRTLEINIPYSTSSEKTNRAVEIVRNILAPRDASDKDAQVKVGAQKRTFDNSSINQPNYPPRVFFRDIQSDSLVIEMNYWYHPPNWWDFVEHAHWVNVQILEEFDKEGIEIAMPSHKVHIAGSENIPLTPDTGN